MPDILHLVRLPGPPERAYEALTTAEGVRQWWTRDASLDEAVGGTGEFRFYGGRVVTRVRIEALAPSSRVNWTVVSSDAPGGWEGTTIRFDLRPDGEDTVLLLAHRDFAEDSEDFARVNTGWAYFLVSLQQHLTTGCGAPAPDVDFARMTARA